MNKSIWKKSANIFVCGLLGAAILVAGCGDNKTSAAVHDKPAVWTRSGRLPPLPDPLMCVSSSTVRS